MFSKMTRFKSLLEAVPEALVGMDQSGVIWFVNRHTELLFGNDRDELVGQPIATLLPEHLRRICAEYREGCFADLKTRSGGVDLELTGRRRDGTEFPVNISVSHIDTGDVLLVIAEIVGKPARYLSPEDRTTEITAVIHRDMSELEHAAQYARSLIEAGPDPLVTITPCFTGTAH